MNTTDYIKELENDLLMLVGMANHTQAGQVTHKISDIMSKLSHAIEEAEKREKAKHYEGGCACVECRERRVNDNYNMQAASLSPQEDKEDKE